MQRIVAARHCRSAKFHAVGSKDDPRSMHNEPRTATRSDTPISVLFSLTDSRGCATPIGSQAGTPIRLISHSSSTPELSFTRRRTVFAKRLDVGRGGRAEIDQEVAMQLRDLRAADDQPAAAGGVDQLPGLSPGGFLKVEPPVRLLIGCVASRYSVILSISAAMAARIARPALECGLGEDEILRRAAMPVAVMHVGVGEACGCGPARSTPAPRPARPWSRPCKRRRSCAARRRSRPECRARTPGPQGRPPARPARP